ncbi:GNAT family N-acetyltransferase [Polymorphum gilvum]|uniref:Acetyltransferase, GNAT family n=1 Tax=Polymorphum gilvum (strain LMG 25793 / CGMCC 1.9160 / SL003B-26A1) TaxID=991905 RepID=F2J2B1_POLGS|nr:GNAT family N-acetyltransferase [Polymorphum gilvum]ADZ69807.1 Acetyltransferase, GNAT family [Polymorphum gilvum SL003B-26A1]
MAESAFTGVWRRFDQLSVAELHALLKLRVDVFVVEQACPYREIDGLDPQAEHYLLRDADGALAGCLRLFAPGVNGPQARLGRIVVAPQRRGLKLGHQLVAEGIARARALHPGCAIALSAQAHLEDFYAGHGFAAVSPPYLEDGIAHVDMLLGGAD